MLKTVGFDRYIQLDWLNAIAGKLCVEGENRDSIRDYLHDLLKADYPNYEARRKTITVLTRIWTRIPSKMDGLQEQAVSLFDKVAPAEKIWLHWGMTMAAYPFFEDITSAIGRLLSLQGETTTNQIHQRIEEKWGQRTTVVRAIDRVIQSMYEWKVIQLLDDNNNTIRALRKFSTNKRDLQLWLLQAVLLSEGTDSMQVQQAMSFPSIFPFTLNITRLDLQKSNVWEYSKQDINTEILTMRHWKAN